MKSLILILISFILVSCGSHKKFKGERYFKVKEYINESNQKWKNIFYNYTTENDQHCFIDTDDREIVTVEDMNTAFAIDHFYKRVVKVDIQVQHRLNGKATIVMTNESAQFDLEIASCLMGYKDLFVDQRLLYTSFRLRR